MRSVKNSTPFTNTLPKPDTGPTLEPVPRIPPSAIGPLPAESHPANTPNNSAPAVTKANELRNRFIGLSLPDSSSRQYHLASLYRLHGNSVSRFSVLRSYDSFSNCGWLTT